MLIETLNKNEKDLLKFFYLKGNQTFLDKPNVYYNEIGITENEYVDILKILSEYGLIENGIKSGNTDVKLTDVGIMICRTIINEESLKWYKKLLIHLEKKNNVYALLISVGALIVSIIALTK